MEWLLANKEWIFSGVGLLVLPKIYRFFFRKNPDFTRWGKQVLVINNENSIGVNSKNSDSFAEKKISEKSLDDYKNETYILFIDDDTKFRVAKILANTGWVHTKLIKDVKTLDEPDILRARILFIDVQGVGVLLGFNDEGLGLALAIKEKYPEKKVVIYSAETKGDRFHAALRKADSFLSKNADPYEFQKIVEDFTIGTKS